MLQRTKNGVAEDEDPEQGQDGWRRSRSEPREEAVIGHHAEGQGEEVVVEAA